MINVQDPMTNEIRMINYQVTMLSRNAPIIAFRHLSFIGHWSLVIGHSAAVFLTFAFFLLYPAAAADWPQFLGPERSGIADASETVAA